MHGMRMKSSWRGAVSASLSVLVATALLAGCGGTSSSSSTSAGASTSASGAAGASTSSTAGSGSSASAMKAAQQIVTLAETKLLYGPTTGPATASQLHAPTDADIQVFPYKPSGSKSIVFVSCSAESGQCTHSAEIGKAFLDKLGVKSTVVQSNYTPAGNQQAMNTALSLKPNAIITLAIAPDTIGPQIATAKSDGIPVLDGYGTEPIDGGNLSAYVPQGSSLYQIAAAAELIASTNGKGSVAWLSAPEFPELEVDAGTSFFKSTCSTCALISGTETAAQVTNPVTMGQLVTSNIQAHPGLGYVMLASACADLQAAAQAIPSGGTTKLGAPGCGASAVSAMNAGQIPFATGEVEPWGTLAAIDQVFRLWAGKPALPASETGPAAYLVTPTNTPDHSMNVSYGKLDRWQLSLFNYLAPYDKAWGVNLEPVIQNEQ
jgi:ABC-type sugar transport system substrate-binding protein